MTDTAVLDKPAADYTEPELPDMPPKALEDVPAKDRPTPPKDDAKPKRMRRRDRTPASSATPPKRGPGRPPKDRTPELVAELEPKLVEFFQGVGMVAAAVNPLDGVVLLERAQPNAKAFAKLAAENEQFAALIRRLTSGGAYGAALVALASTVVPILANHGVAVPMGDAMLAPYKAKAAELGITLPPEPAQPDAAGVAGL